MNDYFFRDERDVRKYISDHLDVKINAIVSKAVEEKLEQWYRQNIKEQVDAAIKEAFSKMMIVKFGE